MGMRQSTALDACVEQEVDTECELYAPSVSLFVRFEGDVVCLPVGLPLGLLGYVVETAAGASESAALSLRGCSVSPASTGVSMVL